MNKKPKSVDAYIKAAPREAQAKLKHIRKIIKAAAPKATERISYGIPYYDHVGRLAYFMLARAHIGLYLMPPVVAKYRRELAGYATSKSTIRLPLGEKIPVMLVRKLIKASVAHNDARYNEKTCSRGHEFQKSSSQPVCPTCWPGRYRKKLVLRIRGNKAKGV